MLCSGVLSCVLVCCGVMSCLVLFRAMGGVRGLGGVRGVGSALCLVVVMIALSLHM